MQKSSLSLYQRINMNRNVQIMHERLSQPCADCELCWHPLVMTFDHRDRKDKDGNIQRMRAVPTSQFVAELDKCDVVCRNCHQMREYMRDLQVEIKKRSKVEKHRYYHRLLPYVTKGALIQKGAFEFEGIGNLR